MHIYIYTYFLKFEKTYRFWLGYNRWNRSAKIIWNLKCVCKSSNQNLCSVQWWTSWLQCLLAVSSCQLQPQRQYGRSQRKEHSKSNEGRMRKMPSGIHCQQECCQPVPQATQVQQNANCLATLLSTLELFTTPLQTWRQPLPERGIQVLPRICWLENATLHH